MTFLPGVPLADAVMFDGASSSVTISLWASRQLDRRLPKHSKYFYFKGLCVSFNNASEAQMQVGHSPTGIGQLA
jgi:hypothetical protein